MYYTYVLRDGAGNFYKGHTNNLERRLKEHKAGHTFTTRKMSGLEVVYIEEYDNVDEAVKREKYFKNAAGRKFLRQKLMRS